MKFQSVRGIFNYIGIGNKYLSTSPFSDLQEVDVTLPVGDVCVNMFRLLSAG